MLTPDQIETIEELQGYLTRVAHNIVRTSYPWADPDDLLQEMNVYILERAQQDPEFLDQTRSYITRAAAWNGRNALRGACRERNHTPLEMDGEGDTPAMETRFAENGPDVELSVAVTEALSALGDKALKIAKLIAAGWTGNDLARAAGLTSRKSVTYYRKQIAEALAPVMGV